MEHTDGRMVPDVDLGGRTPGQALFYAIKTKQPVTEIERLLASIPEAAKEKDRYGQFPLHYAAEKQASEEVVQALIAAFPEAAQAKDTHGKLPLHWAAGSQASADVV